MDGGLVALGGFLYQTVGSLGLKAAYFQEHENTLLKNDLEKLFGFAKDGEVRYEDGDQDASIKQIFHDAQPGYILVQFKYSSLPLHRRPKIDAGEIKAIITRLKVSEGKFRAEGRQVTAYSLLTNRQLNSNAQKLVDAFAREKSCSFYIISSLPEHFWEERLRQFARTFSCNEAEIEEGICKGIGELLRKAIEPGYYGEPVISTAMLINMFTGSEKAQVLTPANVERKSQQELDLLFQRPFDLGTQLLLVRDEIHQQLSRLVDQHAFIILSGDGGNGKTAVLWQWFQERLSTHVPQQVGAYYSVSPACDVSGNFLTHLFCDWVGVLARHRWCLIEQPEEILDRLTIARDACMKAPTTERAIFVLGLDAVDEAFLEREQRGLKDLLLWFWRQEQLRQPPRATLIITCREPKELERRWLKITSLYDKQANPFVNLEIVVDAFSHSEVVATARCLLPALLAERFAQTYSAFEIPNAHSPALDLEMTSVLQPENALVQPVHEDVFEALRHPTLWHCLLKMKEAEQSQVLNGEIGALEQWASYFLHWFCGKAQRRKMQTQEDEEIIAVLEAVACQCDPRRSLRYRRQDWVMYASRTPYLGREEADFLYKEACSSGLILPDGGGWWRWRHAFIGEYLARQQPISREGQTYEQ